MAAAVTLLMLLSELLLQLVGSLQILGHALALPHKIGMQLGVQVLHDPASQPGFKWHPAPFARNVVLHHGNLGLQIGIQDIVPSRSRLIKVMLDKMCRLACTSMPIASSTWLNRRMLTTASLHSMRVIMLFQM